jgi:alpha amylase catalytic region
MQWNDSQFAGFSSAKPWLPVNENHTKINVDSEKITNDSLLNMHRKLLKLRQTFPILKNGNLSIARNTGNGFILGLKRELAGQRAYVFINFANTEQSFSIPENAKIIASTHSVDLITVENIQMTIPGYCGILLIVQ